ncbi:MAG TPA: hypothetical protein VK457_20335 [Chloroflexota bacterium]|nr:hypothetical protein [Chloroflexota bacterium]
MTQTQLLALDTILPTVLCVIGLVFLAAAIWPIATPGRAYFMRSAVFGVVGVACIGVGVWLWLVVLQTASKLVVQELPPPGGTSSITTAQRPSVPPSSSAAAASPAPSLVSASPAAVPSSAVPPSAAPTTAVATPTIPPNLTPVATVAFQPENTQPHAAIVGVEPFEHGSMLYRDDIRQIYVMTLDNKFKVYPDTWMEGRDPDLGSLTPIAAKFYPKRGFGWLWASDPDVRQTLGLALAPEQGFTGSISGDGSATSVRADVTYIFNKDGTWALK